MGPVVRIHFRVNILNSCKYVFDFSGLIHSRIFEPVFLEIAARLIHALNLLFFLIRTAFAAERPNQIYRSSPLECSAIDLASGLSGGIIHKMHAFIQDG